MLKLHHPVLLLALGLSGACDRSSPPPATEDKAVVRAAADVVADDKDGESKAVAVADEEDGKSKVAAVADDKDGESKQLPEAGDAPVVDDSKAEGASAKEAEEDVVGPPESFGPMLAVELGGAPEAVAERMAKIWDEKCTGAVESRAVHESLEAYVVRVHHKPSGDAYPEDALALVVRSAAHTDAFLLAGPDGAISRKTMSAQAPKWEEVAGSGIELSLEVSEVVGDEDEVICSRRVTHVMCSEGEAGFRCAGVPLEEHVYTGILDDEGWSIDCSDMLPDGVSHGYRSTMKRTGAHVVLSKRGGQGKELKIFERMKPAVFGRVAVDELYRSRPLPSIPAPMSFDTRE